LPMKMEQTECSETSAYKIQTPGNYPEENIQQKRLSWEGHIAQKRGEKNACKFFGGKPEEKRQLRKSNCW